MRKTSGGKSSSGAPADLVKAAALLLRLVRAVEEMGEDSGEGIDSLSAWDAYAAAREFLGCPVVLFKGGHEGEHYHEVTFDSDRDTCYWCESWADEQASTGGA